MSTRSPQVDAYIANSSGFAQPILTKIRHLFHKACPDVEETIKWRCPHFEYRGLLGSMAAFQQHVGFGFSKGSLMSDPQGLLRGVGQTTMHALKVRTFENLPPDKVLLAYIKEAVRLNEEGIKPPSRAKKAAKKKPIRTPSYFLAALRKHPKALATFEAFSPSHKREYIEWITEAKQEETRQRRIATALDWLTQGKPRNWKYIKR
jgi:hypothetical protein